MHKFQIDIWKTFTTQILSTLFTYFYGTNAHPRIVLVVL